MEGSLIARIADEIEARYLFPGLGQKLAQKLRTQNFEGLAENEFADVVTEWLIVESGDKHFFLRYSPDEIGTQTDHEGVMRAHGEEARFRNYGFQAVDNLAGNIGYWHLMELAPPVAAGDLLQAALTLLARCAALIIDLQGNRSGTPEMVQAIASQFVEPNQPLSRIESRQGGDQAFTTLADAQRFLNTPLAVLIDGETFSASEALAYDLQCLKRAKLFRKRSKGGAHLSNFVPMEGKWLLRLPIARALNPITQSNWEAEGVSPDAECEDALNKAHRYLLETLIAKEADSRFRPQWESALKAL